MSHGEWVAYILLLEDEVSTVDQLELAEALEVAELAASND